MHAHADTYKSGWAGIRRGGRAWGITELVPAIPPPPTAAAEPTDSENPVATVKVAYRTPAS